MHLTRPDVSLRGRFAPVAISGRHFQFVQGADKTYQPIASVAAFPAQPLAALPPYGCGVPFTGVERLVGVIQRQQGTGAPRHSLTCHCEATKWP